MSSSQSFNANPEIFVPSVESFRQGKSDTIWVPYGEPESDEEEEDSAIDAQEVYGSSFRLRQMTIYGG